MDDGAFRWKQPGSLSDSVENPHSLVTETGLSCAKYQADQVDSTMASISYPDSHPQYFPTSDTQDNLGGI